MQLPNTTVRVLDQRLGFIIRFSLFFLFFYGTNWLVIVSNWSSIHNSRLPSKHKKTTNSLIELGTVPVYTDLHNSPKSKSEGPAVEQEPISRLVLTMSVSDRVRNSIWPGSGSSCFDLGFNLRLRLGFGSGTDEEEAALDTSEKGSLLGFVLFSISPLLFSICRDDDFARGR